MTLNLHYCCDVPGCKSNVTLSPVDVKENVLKALEDRGWTVTKYTAEPEKPTKVKGCLCPTHKPQGSSIAKESDVASETEVGETE